MEKLNKNKGITLIALVISIIVMLILVAVSISMAVNGGLFNYAGKAVGDTRNAIDKENELSNGKIQIDGKWYTSIDNYLNGKVELPEGLKVGDYVNYTPTTGTYKVADGENGSGYTTDKGYQEFTTDSTMKWRVWSIDKEKGTIELISATAVHSLYLNGADGYNHAVDILNDLCKTLYSNENGATARSINVEDINAKTKYEYTEFTYTSDGFSIKYGDTKQLSKYGTSYMKYPNLYSQELGYGTANEFNETGLNGSEGLKNGVTDEKGITTYSAMGYTDGNAAGTDPYLTETYYGFKEGTDTYYPDQCLDTSLGINTAPTGLINLGQSYWLASRCVGDLSYSAFFYVRFMHSNGGVRTCLLFRSSNKEGGYSYACRPIVSLNSNVSLTLDRTTESVTYWNIEY